MKKTISIFSIFTIFFTICSCTSFSPKSIKLMAGKPMGSTSIDSYPGIKTLFQSDKELYIVTYWQNCIQSRNHEMKWELINDNGFIVYSHIEKNVDLQPHLFHTAKILISNDEKEKLLPGEYTVKFYLDGILSKKIGGRFVANSIVNKNVKGAVVLPFHDISLKSNMKFNESPYIVNTFSSAFFNEIRRIIPLTTPHYVSERKTGGLLGPGCFGDETCLKKLDHLFNEEIYIFGNIALPRYVTDIATLKVYVYSSKIGSVKKFSYSQTPSGELTYAKIMLDLINGVMHEKGFLEYLISL